MYRVELNYTWYTNVPANESLITCMYLYLYLE